MSWYDLPEVALIRVLNYLPVKDQLNVRLVCRHWKQITDSSVQRDELILFVEIHPRPVYWYHNGKEADLGNAFLVNKRGFLSNEFPLRFFRRVRRLIVATRMHVPSKRLVELVQASYQHLEHLQFKYIGSKCYIAVQRLRVYEMNLQLANLRTFYSRSGDMPLGLHCPKLTELYVYSHLNINEATDEQTRLCIQRLRILLVHKLTYPPGFEFSNLEVFYFNEPSSTITLSDFPCLKEIHFFDEFSMNIGSIRFREALENLLEQKRSLKLNQLRVYFDGFELNDRSEFQVLETYVQLNEIRCSLSLDESVLRLIQENPSRLKLPRLLSKNLLMTDRLDDQLIGLPEGDELVESMYRSVKDIWFEQPLAKKPLNLFKLSDKFQYVCAISVIIELSQNHLDRLPDALPHLVNFSYHPKFFKDHILNFEFIAKFKSLHCFHVHHRLLSIDELRLILENCKFIDRFSYQKSNCRVEVSRDFLRKVYHVVWRSSDFVTFASATFSLVELLDYFRASKWVEKKVDFLGEREEESTRLQLRPFD